METINKVIKNLKLILQNRGWIEATAHRMVDIGHSGSGYGMVEIDGLETSCHTTERNVSNFNMRTGVCHNANLYLIDNNQFAINGAWVNFIDIENAKTNYLRDHLEQMYVCVRDKIRIDTYFAADNYDGHPTFFIHGDWGTNEMWLEKDRWYFVEFCLKELEHLRDHGEMINHEKVSSI